MFSNITCDTTCTVMCGIYWCGLSIVGTCDPSVVYIVGSSQEEDEGNPAVLQQPIAACGGTSRHPAGAAHPDT